MSGFVRACALSSLVEGTARHVDIDGEPVVVVLSHGRVHALRDVCSHAEVPLSEGDVYDGTIECWLHGSAFDLATGKPTALPATEPVPVYPVTIEGDDVLVAVEES